MYLFVLHNYIRKKQENMGSTFSIINDTGKSILVYHEVTDSSLQNASFTLKETIPIAFDTLSLLTENKRTKKQFEDAGKVTRACGTLTQEYQRQRRADLSTFSCIQPYRKYVVKKTPMSDLCVKISFDEKALCKR